MRDLREIKHLALGTLLVIGISLSFGFGALGQADWVFVLSALAIVITMSFFTHELAHKVTAQRRGLWAEFRLTVWGAILTSLSIFLPFKIISPGAVMISGPVGVTRNGKISAMGPGISLVLAVIFLILHFTLQGQGISIITYYGFLVNSWIGLFNLIPFAMFDGKKILRWNKVVYGIMVFIAFILMMFQSVVSL